jgi:hypothetical protein
MADVDGPITSPSQVDPDLIVATIEPKRVPCSELSADSPWRRPGQVCAPGGGGSIVDFFKGLYDKVAGAAAAVPDAAPAPAPTASSPSLLVLVMIGGAGYYLLKRKRGS